MKYFTKGEAFNCVEHLNSYDWASAPEAVPTTGDWWPGMGYTSPEWFVRVEVLWGFDETGRGQYDESIVHNWDEFSLLRNEQKWAQAEIASYQEYIESADYEYLDANGRSHLVTGV